MDSLASPRTVANWRGGVFSLREKAAKFPVIGENSAYQRETGLDQIGVVECSPIRACSFDE